VVLVGLEELRGAEQLHVDPPLGGGLDLFLELLQVQRGVMRRRELVADAHREVGGQRARAQAEGCDGAGGEAQRRATGRGHRCLLGDSGLGREAGRRAQATA